ncbi:hypothetical protein AUK22_04510 [bacterium CG2_30_54_10]|nr:MAG: hypothetical protein AUK22_04510 [bacterium CG2_30_54_10]
MNSRRHLPAAALLAAWLSIFLGISAFAEAPPPQGVAATGSGIHSPCQIQREEISTSSPFGPYREKSSQRLTYNHQNPYLVSEFEYRHVLFKDYKGVAPRLNQLYQASFFGRNMETPLEFKAGRIWIGNHSFRPVDGVSWWYPWGRRLSTTLEVGQISKIDDKTRAEGPGYFEGELRYRFNEQAALAVQSGQDYKNRFSSFQLSYHIDSLRLIGEYASSGATDTWRLGLQYYDGQRVDITSDYRLQMNGTTNSGITRNLIGLDMGSFYLETGIGGRFYFDDGRLPRSTFYEGTLTWGAPWQGKDKLSLGYLLETSPASTSHTLSGTAERNVSKKTRISLILASTRFGGTDDSIQNLEGRLRRLVEWGYYELRLAVINGGSRSDLQKDVGLSAGYQF